MRQSVELVADRFTINMDRQVGCGYGGQSGGRPYSPGIDDGYYTLLPPLSLGMHTLHIQGQVPLAGVTIDVTYNLTIVPVVLK